MLRRAATLLRRRRSGIPRYPSTASTLPSIRHAPAELGRAPTVPPLGTGAGGTRSYARMARRLPPARPDGYTTSGGEADEPDPPALGEDYLEPPAGVGEEDDEDPEGSEMEGFMLEFGSGSDTDDEENDEEDAEERNK